MDEAEEEDELEEDIEDQLVAEMKSRGPQKYVSTFAFTATPKRAEEERPGREVLVWHNENRKYPVELAKGKAVKWDEL